MLYFLMERNPILFTLYTFIIAFHMSFVRFSLTKALISLQEIRTYLIVFHQTHC